MVFLALLASLAVDHPSARVLGLRIAAVELSPASVLGAFPESLSVISVYHLGGLRGSAWRFDAWRLFLTMFKDPRPQAEGLLIKSRMAVRVGRLAEARAALEHAAAEKPDDLETLRGN